jgi:hypothetical protein
MTQISELTQEPEAERPSGLIAFMPWLRLRAPVTVGGIEFVPFRDSEGNVALVFANVKSIVSMILSSYVDRTGTPIENAVLATIPGREWRLTDNDHETVSWAARLLFCACWGNNEQFSQFSGRYISSVPFRLVWQRFSGGPYIAITSRRRYGYSLDGGYKHGEVTFSIPSQCGMDAADVDQLFLDAIVKADATGTSQVMERVSLPFVGLANTDDDLMDEPAEAILMACAFEHLFNADGQKRKLTERFGDLFAPYGGVTVANALKVRPGIMIDQSDPARAASQPNWWVHQKWIEELYDVRNKSAHKGTTAGRTWGWTPFEHLVMAAFTFPLALKLLLAAEGHYAVTGEDIAKCKTVDTLLAVSRWDTRNGENFSDWHQILAKEQSDQRFAAAFEKAKAEHPDLFP